MPQPEINSILISSFGIMLAATLAFIAQQWRDNKAKAAAVTAQRNAERTEATAEAAVLRTEIAELRQALVPVSTAFQAILIKGLTHMTHPVADALLKKACSGELTTHEEEQLISTLKERVDSPGPFISQVEIDAAIMLPLVMRRVNAEKALGVHDSRESLAVPGRRSTD